MNWKDPQQVKAYQAAYRATHREQIAAYRATNREKRIAQSAAYRAANREKVAAYNAAYMPAYQAAHREQKAACAAAHYAANREQIAAKIAAYRATPQGKAGNVATRHRRRARKTANTPPGRMLTGAQWADVLFRSKGKCYWCGKKCKPTIDHVIPFNKGGWHTAENVVVACRSCNSKKHTKILTLL